MNFLAHFHLSGDDELLAIGNFIGDFIKGSDLPKYPEIVQKGVQLHRFIDEFTDSHPEVKKVNALINPYFSKYSTVVSDIYFDYFLASNFTDYSNQSLRDYTDWVYDIIKRNVEFLPTGASRFYYFALARDVFFEYGNKGGMRHVFNGMAGRARFNSNMEQGVPILIKHEKELYHHFSKFYPELMEASKNFVQEELS